MNDENKIIFDELKTITINAHMYWWLYRDLFGTNPERVEIINNTTPAVFVIFRNMFIDYITLAISKLSDPPRFKENNNLSLAFVLELVKDDLDNSVYQNLESKLSEINKCSEIFRKRRNKIVAHADYNHIVNQLEYIEPKFSRKDVEDVLRLVRDFLNQIEIIFFKAETFYDNFLDFEGDDGSALLINLAKSLAYDSLVKNTVIDKDLWQQFGKI